MELFRSIFRGTPFKISVTRPKLPRRMISSRTTISQEQRITSIFSQRGIENEWGYVFSYFGHGLVYLWPKIWPETLGSPQTDHSLAFSPQRALFSVSFFPCFSFHNSQTLPFPHLSLIFAEIIYDEIRLRENVTKVFRPS